MLAMLALVLLWRGAAPPPLAARAEMSLAFGQLSPSAGIAETTSATQSAWQEPNPERADAGRQPPLTAALPVPPGNAMPLSGQRLREPKAEGRRPLLALVIDDLGLNHGATQRAIALQGPLTLAFLPYGRELSALAEEARQAGHELLVHMPMEPDDPTRDPGPLALRSGLTDDELQARLAWNLSRFEGFVGINNHMGSRFTRSRAGMTQVMRALNARRLLFLDSVTTGDTVGFELARQHGVAVAVRDIFLDNDRERGEILRKLEAALRLALKHGQAVAIGHPYPETLDVLEPWLREVEARGVALAPVSALARPPGD